MELKWLEDFISLARSGSFSRSATERHVTQPAFSRRIQALELWLGVALIDRSAYPTRLTPAGRQFREVAEETVRQLHAVRQGLQDGTGSGAGTISVAALHSPALTFFPRWFAAIQARTAALGSLGSHLLPDNFHNCMQAFVEGGHDFLLTFHHPRVPIALDPALYPALVVGTDALVAVRRADAGGAAAPMLRYAPDSYLGRLTASVRTPPEPACDGPVHVNENAMAEALKYMVLAGHGQAWLPRSLIERELDNGALVAEDASIALEIRLYRNGERRRPVLDQVWQAAQDDLADAGGQAGAHAGRE